MCICICKCMQVYVYVCMCISLCFLFNSAGKFTRNVAVEETQLVKPTVMVIPSPPPNFFL